MGSESMVGSKGMRLCRGKAPMDAFIGTMPLTGPDIGEKNKEAALGSLAVSVLNY